MKRIINVIGGVFAFITGMATITPQLSKDLGKFMDEVYSYIPQWGFGIITIVIILVLWIINSPKKEQNQPLISNNTLGNKNTDFTGSKIENSTIGIGVEDKKQDEIISEVKVAILPSHDEPEKDYVFKRIQLINQNSRKLLSCYVTVTSFSVSPRVGDFINLASDDMVWSKSNSRVSNNRIDLVEGIPANLHIARVNLKKKTAEVVGVNGLYTNIKKGLYSLYLRLDSDNFESARAFSVEFYYDGKKSIEFKTVSGLSNISFVYGKIDGGSHKMKFDS